ncbi:MAG: cytochrome C [Deferribacterota bacterium]|nr:cytochrome C [Deferribacterota bacterium]
MKQKDKIRRFSIYRISEHLICMILTTLLLITGFVQKFYTLDISMWLIKYFGGIDNVVLIHMYFGVSLICLFIIHILYNFVGILYFNMEVSMMITKEDFDNFIKDLKYFIRVTNKRAENDRYTYRQKFEYWGIFISILLLIFSGIILCFPITLTNYLPGIIIPIAKTVHYNQAIILFIIIVSHIYNAIFNPDAIPLDTSIFTGYLSKKRYIKEHFKEYKRKFED